MDGIKRIDVIRVKLTILFFCIGSYASLEATECSDRYFLEKHLNLAICKNHGQGLEEAALYYEGVAKALNDYIALRIERGELEDKKFEIWMLDPILTQPHISLTQSKKGYYISTGRAHSLHELMCMIDEFTSPGFISMHFGIWDYEDERGYDRKTRQMERIEERLFSKELLQPDLDIIKNKEYITYQQNKLKLVYLNDTVRCFIANKEIPSKLKGLPWNIRDRYILQECGVLKVYQESVLIKTFRQKDIEEWDCEYMYEVQVFDKWVNFDAYNNLEYSYSYDKNRFYIVRRDE